MEFSRNLTRGGSLEEIAFYRKPDHIALLRQGETGTPVPELCREHGISTATFYNWRSKYGGMDASMMSRLKELEADPVLFALTRTL